MVASKNFFLFLVSIVAWNATANTMPHAPSASCREFIHTTCGGCKEAGLETSRRECVLNCLETEGSSSVCGERVVKMKAKAACYDFINNSCTSCSDLPKAEMKQCVSTCLAAEDSNNICEGIHKANNNRAQQQRPPKSDVSKKDGQAAKTDRQMKKEQRPCMQDEDSAINQPKNNINEEIVDWNVPETSFPDSHSNVAAPDVAPEQEQNVEWNVPPTYFPAPNIDTTEINGMPEQEAKWNIPQTYFPVPNLDTSVNDDTSEQNVEWNVIQSNFSAPYAEEESAENEMADQDQADSLTAPPADCGYVCAIYCPQGNVMDEFGCPTCMCK
ncbi:hypothetical protein SARC_12863 [Sphaeroforma arctica JP610]|uniref:Antistasin-like domain-containing protein n=1 Tax=Sphaeroforma arctica JP610 TaxID=667725 RepID=A0A0L0FCW3_9EUKA|nr:hypothetical protein SARC_12863 [Sphaeroforma arctica JP610]KNC74594.1 hypothetical protein SARC_12863 [Sphaeroforma arctica JP610]|eukprot:XP_014148496.1 hypothetical protein SARC_12863 [Sphaeroforma arctica JP610]